MSISGLAQSVCTSVPPYRLEVLFMQDEVHRRRVGQGGISGNTLGVQSEVYPSDYLEHDYDARDGWDVACPSRPLSTIVRQRALTRTPHSRQDPRPPASPHLAFHVRDRRTSERSLRRGRQDPPWLVGERAGYLHIPFWGGVCEPAVRIRMSEPRRPANHT